MKRFGIVGKIVLTCACCAVVLFGVANDAMAQKNVGSQKKAAGGVSMDALIVPDANIMFKCDIQKARKSAAGAKLETMQQNKAACFPDMDKLNEKLKQLGVPALDPDSFSVFMLYMRMDEVSFDSPDKSSAMAKLDLLFGTKLEKPISMAQLEGVIQATYETVMPSTEKKKIGQQDYKGYKLLSTTGMFPEPSNCPPPAKPLEFLMGLSPDGKLLFGGIADSVKAAIDRAQSGKKASLSQEMLTLSKSVPASAQYQLVANVPEAVRKKLRKPIDLKQAADAGAPMPQPQAMVIKQIDSLVAFATLGENIDIDIRANCADKESAQLLNAMVSPLIMASAMQLPKQADGKPATRLESTLKSEAAPDSKAVKLSGSLSPKDFDTLSASTSPTLSPAMMFSPKPATTPKPN